MANYTGASFFTLPRPIAYKNGVNIGSIATNITLTYESSMIQLLTNSTLGALNVTLPAEKNGASFWIKNQSGSANNISVNNPAAAGVVLLTPGQTGYVVCDGSSWTVLIKA